MRYWLVIVGGIVLGLGMGIVNLTDTLHGVDIDSRGLYYFHIQTKALSSILKSYKEQHGHYPSNDEGLWAVSDVVKQQVAKEDKAFESSGRCRVTASGILSWWGDPIIYENHEGQHSKAFAWQDVKNDPQHKYSCRVDKDIYLWSIGAKIALEREAEKNRFETIVICFTLLASFTLLMLFVMKAMQDFKDTAWYQRAFRVGYVTSLGILIMLITALPFILFMFGCGFPGMQTQRTPELTHECISIMRSYRDNGVISSKTYSKMIYALQQDRKNKLYYKY